MPKKTPENFSVTNSEQKKYALLTEPGSHVNQDLDSGPFQASLILWNWIAKNFLAFILTQYHTLPKEHIQKSNIILNDIVSYGFLKNSVKKV